MEITKWDRLVVVYWALLIQTDWIMITDLRDFLLQFGVGTIDYERTETSSYVKYLMNRISMSYLRKYVHDHIKIFDRFYRIYIADIVTVIPQYIILLVLIARKNTQFSFWYFAPIVIKIIILFIVRSQEDDNRRIIYRNYLKK